MRRAVLAGCAVLALAGSSPPAAAVATGLAVAAMPGTRTLHPPAAADPFPVATGGLGLGFLAGTIVGGSLSLCAFAGHRLVTRTPWPRPALAAPAPPP